MDDRWVIDLSVLYSLSGQGPDIVGMQEESTRNSYDNSHHCSDFLLIVNPVNIMLGSLLAAEQELTRPAA
jgi:hypothetical protein